MIDPIADFLESRKQAKLEKPENKEQSKQSKIEQEFETKTWIANASRRMAMWKNPDTRLSFVTHPGKFSYPYASISNVLYNGVFSADGYLRSGNANSEHDVTGDAKLNDINTFLTLKLGECTILEHFEKSTDTLNEFLGVDEETFKHWRAGFLKVKENPDEIKTHPNVKQVYFPVEDGYHLLSVLYPSGLMTEQYKRIQAMKFSDETKAAREARNKGELHAQGFTDILGLLTQNFGGTKPLNISKLNSSNRGKAWLLPCLPPVMKQHYLRLPKYDFFQWLFVKDQELHSILKALHRLLQADYNNAEIRKNRVYRVSQLFEWVLYRASMLQQQTPGWSKKEGFQLPLEQQLWLDAIFIEDRERQEDWRDSIARRISEWILFTYRRFQKHQSQKTVQLGETEAIEFQKELLEYVRQHKEFIL